jgi:hypothetical protein
MADQSNSPGSSRPPRTLSNPGTLKAMSAARAQPADEDEDNPKLSKKALRAGAENTALNALGVLRDTWEDFRSSDRFFKYKAGVLATWIALSVASFVVACPGSGPSNNLGAHLDSVPPAVASDPPLFFVKNDSDQPWFDVVITVNGTYKVALSTVTANGQVPLSPKQLLGPDGSVAPGNLKIVAIEVHTDRGNTELMRGGQIQ